MPKKKLTAAERRQHLHQNKLVLRKWLKGRNPKIIALDISTTSTGVYVTKTEVTLAIVPGKIPIRVRINEIGSQIEKILNKQKPDICIIEDYAFSLRASSVVQLAECGGVVRNLLYEHMIPFFAIAPQTLKKFVLGQGKSAKAKGKQTKSLMLMEVFVKWGHRFDNDDQCDAFCLAMFLVELFAYIQKEDTVKWKGKMFDDFLTTRGDVL